MLVMSQICISCSHSSTTCFTVNTIQPTPQNVVKTFVFVVAYLVDRVLIRYLFIVSEKNNVTN